MERLRPNDVRKQHFLAVTLGRLCALERWLLTAEKAVLIAFVVVMVGLSFVQVLLGFVSLGLLWADTFLRSLVLWVGFLGAGVAAAQDKQFAMDAAARVLRGRARSAVQLVTHLVTAVVCLFLTRASWSFFAGERGMGSVLFSIGSLHVPEWPFMTILPAGFALLAAHYALKLLIAALELIRGPAEEGAS